MEFVIPTPSCPILFFFPGKHEKLKQQSVKESFGFGNIGPKTGLRNAIIAVGYSNVDFWDQSSFQSSHPIFAVSRLNMF